MAPKLAQIEVRLPQDIIFAMREVGSIEREVKKALAIMLFQEKSISLGKAVELAETSRVRFIELLEKHGTPAYEYKEKDFERDQQMIAKYRKSIAK